MVLHRSAQMWSGCGPAPSWPCSGFAVIESPHVSFNLETTVIDWRGLILGVDLIFPDGFLSPCGRVGRLMELGFDFFQVDYMRAMCPCPPSSSHISLSSCMAIVPIGKPRNLAAQWMSTRGQGAASVVPEHFCSLPPSVWRGPLLHLLP